MSSFDLDQLWTSERATHQEAFDKSFQALRKNFEDILSACKTSIENGGKIMLFGNGGSAADAQHLATELSVRYIDDRKPIAGLALTTDTSVLTAGSNDMGFDQIFARQIHALGKEGDIAIGISTSGNSANIINGLKKAQDINIVTIGFGGRDGGAMTNYCDHTLIIPAQSTARIQEMHILFGHMLCGALEQSLGLV